MRHNKLAILSTAAVSIATVAITIPAVAAPSIPAHGVVTSLLPSDLPQSLRGLDVLGAVAPGSQVAFDVLLRGRNAAELPVLAREVSDPSSPMFRHFLTRSQVRAEFDPTPATTRTVETVLRGLGVTITQVSSDGRLIEATATAGDLTNKLGVRFAEVETDGTQARAALSQPVLPSSISPLVSDIIGLTETPVSPMATGPVSVSTKTSPAYYTARPCVKYFGQKLATNEPKYLHKHRFETICGYTPKQVRAAYRVPQTHLTGAGAKIAIVDDYDSPTMVKDAQHWSKLHGIPTLKASQFVDHTDPAAKHTPETIVDVPGVGAVPGESPQEWSGEQTLDVEMVHAMAPKATIEYYGGDQGVGVQPLEAAFTMAIADDTAQFVSDSWGAYEKYELLTSADVKLMTNELMLGATEGVGAAFSSGDDGDNIENNDVKSDDFPGDTSYGTSVGGTTLEVGKHNKYLGETYWGTREEPKTKNGKAWDPTKVSAGEGPATGPGTLAGAGGGGPSADFAEPSWQHGIVPKSLTSQTYTSPDGDYTNDISGGRVEPDISLVGDSTTGVLVGQTQTAPNGKQVYSEYRIGGTSVSCPLFAGMIALAIQANKDKSLGFVSPAMYTAFKKSRTAFRNPSLGRHQVTIRADYINTGVKTSGLIFHLRLLGQLSSLKDLKGYDDSTGLGTPCGPTFVAAIDKPTVKAKTVKVCRAPAKHHNRTTGHGKPA